MSDVRPKCGSRRTSQHLEVISYETAAFCVQSYLRQGAITGNVTTIVDAFTKAGWLVTIYPTQGTGDATRVTRELAPQFDRVVCCGGDGTLSETAAGLLALPQPPLLGYIPPVPPTTAPPPSASHRAISRPRSWPPATPLP